MEENFVLAEKSYDFFKPEFFSFWNGYNDDPQYLSKHMAASDATVLTMLVLGRPLSVSEVNSIEEITYERIGYPKCWEDDKELYFLELKGEYDFKDNEEEN